MLPTLAVETKNCHNRYYALKLGFPQNSALQKFSKRSGSPEIAKIKSKKQIFTDLGPPSWDAFLHPFGSS